MEHIGEALAKSVHRESRWTATSVGGGGPGRQSCPTCRGHLLNQIYEEDFLGFSYGFRPGRSQHQALDALSYALLKKKVNYVLMPTFEVFSITSINVDG